MRFITIATEPLPPGVKETGVIKTGVESNRGDTRIARFSISKDGSIHLACRAAGVGSYSSASRTWRWLPPTKDAVIRVSTSPDGRMLGVGGYPNSFEMRDAETLNLVASFYGAKSEINSIEWSPDGRYVAAGSAEHVFLMNGHSGELLHTIMTACYSMAWSSNGQFLAVGGNGTISLLDAALTVVHEYRGQSREPVSGIRFVPGRMTFFSISKDGSLMGWRRPRHTAWLSIQAHKSGAIALAVSAELVITKGRDDAVRVFSTDTGRLLATVFDRSTDSGWAIGMEWIVPGRVLALPSNRESSLRILEFDLQRLTFGRLSFLFDRPPGILKRPVRRQPESNLEDVSLVSLLLENEARLCAVGGQSTPTGWALTLRRLWIRCRLHGLAVPHLDALLEPGEPVGIEAERLLAKTSIRMRSDIEVLLADGRGEDVSAALMPQLLSEEARERSFQLMSGLREPLVADEILEVVLTLVAHGGEEEASVAGKALGRGIHAQAQRDLQDRFSDALLNPKLPDTELSVMLRVLRRSLALHEPALASAIVWCSRDATEALKVELFGTLCGMASGAGIIALKTLICLIDSHRSGWEPLVLAVARHPEFQSSKSLRLALTTWQKSGDPHFESIAVWLTRRLKRDNESLGACKSLNENRELPDEDVLDPVFLQSLQLMASADVSSDVVQRVLRLIWLPLLAQSDVPLLARMLFKKWTAAGMTFVVDFLPDTGTDLDRPSDESAALRSTLKFSRFAKRLIGCSEETWLRRVNSEMEQFFKDGAQAEFTFASRLLVDFIRLTREFSPVEDTIHALALQNLGVDASGYSKRANNNHHRCQDKLERATVICLSATLEHGGGSSQLGAPTS